MSLIQKWQGALYFKNLRDYLVDGTALLEIRAMGSSGFLKAMFYWAEPAGEPDFNAELSGPFEMEGRYHKENDMLELSSKDRDYWRPGGKRILLQAVYHETDEKIDGKCRMILRGSSVEVEMEMKLRKLNQETM